MALDYLTCQGCAHAWGDHSHFLAGAPCLDCPCGGFIEMRPPPDTSEWERRPRPQPSTPSPWNPSHRRRSRRSR